MASLQTVDNFDSQVDLLRKLVRNQDTVSQFTVPALTNTGWIYATPAGTPITNTTAVTLPAAVAGKRNYVSGLQFVNVQAPGTVVTLKSGSSVIWTGYAHSSAAVQPNPLFFPTPLVGGVNEAITFECVTTGTITYVSAQGFTV